MQRINVLLLDSIESMPTLTDLTKKTYDLALFWEQFVVLHLRYRYFMNISSLPNIVLLCNLLTFLPASPLSNHSATYAHVWVFFSRLLFTIFLLDASLSIHDFSHTSSLVVFDVSYLHLTIFYFSAKNV